MKISAAVAECLEECRHAEQPLLCLAVFTLALRGDPAWDEPELAEFELAARKRLAQLLGY